MPTAQPKVTYTAKFTGPKGPLNPMGLKIPGTVTVQLFPIRADKWKIRNPDTKGDVSTATFGSPDAAMQFCSELFTEQATQWDIRKMNGTPYDVPLEA